MKFESPEKKRDRLATLKPEIDKLRTIVDSFDIQGKDQRMMVQAIHEACNAALEGNYGIGAVLADGCGNVVARGHNTLGDSQNPWVHVAHAEINAIADYHTKFELGDRDYDSLTLYSTLEPCPMCTCAIFNARIPLILFGAVDEPAGVMHSHPKSFPPLWNMLIEREGIRFKLAQIPEEIRIACEKVFLITRNFEYEEI